MGCISTSFDTVDDLCAELKISPTDFMGCAHNVSHHVKRIAEPKPEGGERIMYAPSDKLKAIQRSIKEVFLATFDYPDYVFGLGGDTLRQHAEVHKGDNKLVKVDIRNFFPSIRHTRVYDMWISEFGFKPEVASFLTKLTTHKGFLQQGFPTSSHIAAIVSLPMTAELKVYSDNNGLNFSQYVDDLNFSGTSVTYLDIFRLVVGAARRNDFSIKRRKTKVYNAKTGKTITGVSLVSGKTRAPRKIRKRAVDALKAHQASPDDLLSLRRAQGYADHLNQLNEKDGQKYKAAMGNIKNVDTKK